MQLYAVIMAGGIGSRFWPRSREKSPKQLLKIFNDSTMIQDTVDRLKGLIDDDKIFIITNKLHREEILNQLPNLKAENIIAEPFGRNTAPCIGLAALLTKHQNNEALTVVLPADHIIQEKEIFQNTLLRAAEYANQSKGLVTIGIQPTRPETGYGYIQIEDEVNDNIFKVHTFAEKPNYSTALKFLESGDFFWNSGMFIWRSDVILEEIKKYIPDLYTELIELKSVLFTDKFDKKLLDVYGKIKGISIDYGVMEKSRKVFLTKGAFSWSDVGSWEEVYNLTEKDEDGNSLIGEVYTDMTNDSYIYSPDKFTAVIGLENVVVINTDDALLVCRRDQSQEVKKVIDYIKLKKQNKYL
ncbi:MAG: mannose-1-phosphate guanylyltransferase [Chlorobiaceae bacterium]|nr:mannose-1-phosphate guanylyltransferase [Chlorobiaceae bacterium]